MNKKQLKELLKIKPSYLKKGAKWLAEKYKTSTKDVQTVLSELKEETKKYREGEVKSPRVTKLSFFKDIAEPKGKSKIKLTGFELVKAVKKYNQINKSKENVLVIGDLHEPFSLDGYLQHCLDVRERFNCGTIVFIGDLLDNHSISYHEHDPDGKSPYDEYTLAVKRLKAWYKAFPEAKVCIGNHDALGMRKIYTSGLPSFWLKSLSQILEAPKEYNFGFHHVINDVFYTHGTGVSGDAGAMKIASQNRQSAVIGHLHSISNIKYSASYKDIIFAMTVGCGIDYKQYAFNYGKDMTAKPIISCGAVLEGNVPVLIPMQL